MNQETEQKKESIGHKEKRVEKKSEEIKINLTRFGKTNKQILENISFLIVLISSVLFFAGIGLGSFVQGTIFLSAFGSFFVIIGIIIYIISQFIGVKNG